MAAPTISLNAKHHQMLRMAQWGLNSRQIADALGMSHSTANTIMRSPLFVAELERMRHEANDKHYSALGELCKHQEDAVLALVETVQQKDYPTLRFHAARDLLNRTGVSTPRQVVVDKTTMSYEEHLHQVRMKYEPLDTYDDNVIEVIGGTELAEDEDDE